MKCALTSTAARRERGFTLVELLIVVIILGVLAAVVIPQFNDTSAQSKESALVSNLSAMRQAISLYRVQHNEIYPGQNAGTWAEFQTQLLTATDSNGGTSGAAVYGPYLRIGVPNNPVNNLATASIVSGVPAADDSTGYLYDPNTGALRANITGNAPSGMAWIDL